MQCSGSIISHETKGPKMACHSPQSFDLNQFAEVEIMAKEPSHGQDKS